MIGLLKKEFFVLRKSLRTWGVLLFLYAALSATGIWGSTILATMVTMITLMMPLTAFSLDQVTHWDRFAATLPGGREKMVLARYGSSILICLISVVICAVLTIVLAGIGLLETDLMEAIVGVVSCGAVALVMVSVVLPICYKVGPEKARIVFMLVFLVFFGGGVALLGLLPEQMAMPTWIGSAMVTGCVVLPLVALTVSYHLSVDILRKKEL